ncbi:MAG: SGNH/GDSL hydrolase family protein [Lachnospiraceae bacterium]|nr:SGNH/GDSL hydrolase family protein [Lachnospiraceae bacterium]
MISLLEGIKANFLGDSITFGAKVDDQEHHVYWQRLRDNCGLAEARGYGIGGTRIAVQHLKENPKHDQDFLSRVELMDPDADLIVVFGGTNDFGHGDAPLGCMSDRTPYTFYGACHRLMRKLIERYPDAQIVFMTPIHRQNEERGERRLKDFVEAIKKVAEYYAIPVLDLYATSGIQPQVPIIMERFCPDGLHPNDAGHEKIYKRLRGFLERL